MVKKISEKLRGKHPSLATRLKISLALRGRKHSEDTKRLLSESKIGARNPMWRGGRSFNGEYFVLSVNGRKSKEHRHLMEMKIRRKLKKGEVVHHINQIKTDNRIENLYLCKNAKEHVEIHSKLGSYNRK